MSKPMTPERLAQCARITKRLVEWDIEGQALLGAAKDLLAEAERQLDSPYERQRLLREQHDIHIVIERESLDSDEMEYVYEVTYLKPEDEGAKHWVSALTRVRSFGCGPGSYWGAWHTYEEALEEAIKLALTLVQP